MRAKRLLLSAYHSILKKPVPWQKFTPIKGAENGLEFIQLEVDHMHAIMYILSISLLVLFMFDCGAFSAGSIISAIFWMSAGTAALLHSEAVRKGKGDRLVFGEGLNNFVR